MAAAAVSVPKHCVAAAYAGAAAGAADEAMHCLHMHASTPAAFLLHLLLTASSDHQQILGSRQADSQQLLLWQVLGLTSQTLRIRVPTNLALDVHLLNAGGVAAAAAVAETWLAKHPAPAAGY